MSNSSYYGAQQNAFNELEDMCKKAIQKGIYLDDDQVKLDFQRLFPISKKFMAETLIQMKSLYPNAWADEREKALARIEREMKAEKINKEAEQALDNLGVSKDVREQG